MNKTERGLFIGVPLHMEFVPQQWLVLKLFLLSYFLAFASLFWQASLLFGPDGLEPMSVPSMTAANG